MEKRVKTTDKIIEYIYIIYIKCYNIKYQIEVKIMGFQRKHTAVGEKK